MARVVSVGLRLGATVSERREEKDQRVVYIYIYTHACSVGQGFCTRLLDRCCWLDRVLSSTRFL